MTIQSDLTTAASELRNHGIAVTVEKPALAAAATDFGRTVNRVPGLIAQPRTEEQTGHIIRYARAAGIPLTVQGAGGSNRGQSLCSGGILLRRQRSACDEITLLDDDTVEIPACARWGQVEAMLNPKGRQVPVLADYLGLTVGGTLSVGGYGCDSVALGPQVSHVRRVRLIQPNGHSAWYPMGAGGDIDSYALASLGQIGAVERVVMGTRPYRKYTTLFDYEHRSLQDLVNSFEWMARGTGQPELFKGLYARGRATSTYGMTSERAVDAFRARFVAPGMHARRRWIIPRHRQLRSHGITLWVARFRHCHRLWTDYLFDFAGLQLFMNVVSTRLRDPVFAKYLKCLYFLGIRQHPAATAYPLEATRHINAPMAFGVGLYSMIPVENPLALDHVRMVTRGLLQKAAEFGGRPYLYGWHELDRANLDTIYGSDYQRLRTVRAQLDPDHLFQPHAFAPIGPI